MKTLLPVIGAIAFFLLATAPASAYLESVDIPPAIVAGESFPISVSGSLPDPCWEVIDSVVSIVGTEITLDFHIAYTAPPGTGCPAVLVPYEVVEQASVPAAGVWLLRVVEHRQDRPPFLFETIELEFTADEVVAVQKTSWGSLRARYR